MENHVNFVEIGRPGLIPDGQIRPNQTIRLVVALVRLITEKKALTLSTPLFHHPFCTNSSSSGDEQGWRRVGSGIAVIREGGIEQVQRGKRPTFQGLEIPNKSEIADRIDKEPMFNMMRSKNDDKKRFSGSK